MCDNNRVASVLAQSITSVHYSSWIMLRQDKTMMFIFAGIILFSFFFFVELSSVNFEEKDEFIAQFLS